MQAPVFGSFRESVGEFLGEGRPAYVRCRWSRTNTETPRWEQAFSLDDGKTWETNWIADFKRVRSLGPRLRGGD